MISILGCGWYGKALGKAIVQSGEKVNGSTTSYERFDEIESTDIIPYLVKLSADELIAPKEFFDCQTLIVSVTPRLRSGETDYVAKIQQLVAAIIKYGVQQVIYISSTGVYSDCKTDLNENDLPQPQSLSGKILYEAEELFRSQNSFKATIMRFGGLVGPGRHPGRFFAGKSNIPNGQAPVNLIHLQDCVALTQSIIKQQVFGYTFNACAPHHPTKSKFYTKAALHAGLDSPSFIDELQEWKTVNSVNVPNMLHYDFIVDNWDDCFVHDCF